MILIASGVIVSLAAILTIVRIVRGPDFANRVIAFELFSFICICAIAILTVTLGQSVYLDVILIWAMISFLGTVGFSRYLETRGD
jgi:multicomponent Na+:H+ antiporter subunit F